MTVTKELKVSHELDIFYSLGRIAENWSHFAFYYSSEEKFELALGATRSVELETSKNGFELLEEFHINSQNRIAGFLSYDLKNDLENLESKNPSSLNFFDACFFEPEAWLSFDNGLLFVKADNQEIIDQIERNLGNETPASHLAGFKQNILPTTSKDQYLEQASRLKAHIQRGDIYEVNYCIQYEGDVKGFDPLIQFINLQKQTKAPFSVFCKIKDHYILSASPERYLQNTNGRLKSQPIKGTKKRSADSKLDRIFAEQLQQDRKEQSENVMIVDLVRNDLSRVAKRGSVEVSELFGLSTFKTVHHLVSTVEADLDTSKYNAWDAIKTSFPMGSMTGAPKISAMELIDEHENFKRSAYSGAFGWMDPDGNFDFNVLIRTILFNQSISKISFAVGSALTSAADPNLEYEECLLKAAALIESLETSATVNEIASKV